MELKGPREMSDQTAEGSSAWYLQHAERLAAQASDASDPITKAELRRTAQRFRTHAANAAAAEKKRDARALALKIR
jgi:hypothetical protein